jgi:hypothetical protein
VLAGRLLQAFNVTFIYFFIVCQGSILRRIPRKAISTSTASAAELVAPHTKIDPAILVIASCFSVV